MWTLHVVCFSTDPLLDLYNFDGACPEAEVSKYLNSYAQGIVVFFRRILEFDRILSVIGSPAL